MTEPVLDEVELMAMIDELKRVSPGEQEAAIEALEGDHPGVGERARALLALERRAEEITRKLEEAEAAFKKPEARVEPVAARPKPKLVETTKPDEPREWRFVQRADGSKWMVRGKDWRRHFGPVPQLKVVEQAKPEDKPEPEVEVDVDPLSRIRWRTYRASSAGSPSPSGRASRISTASLLTPNLTSASSTACTRRS